MDDTETGSTMGEDRESEVADQAPDTAAESPEPAGAPEAAPAEQEQLELQVDAEAAGAEDDESTAAAEPAPEAVPDIGAGSEPAPETAPEPEPTPTLDELVAELAASEPAEEGESQAAAGDEGEHEAASEGETPDGEAGEEGAPSAAVAEVPETEADLEAEEEAERPVVRRLWTRIPFWVLGLLWAAFAGGLTYLLWPTSSAVFVTSPLYTYLVFGGAGLVFVGLVLGLVIWLSARSAAGPDGRRGIAGAVWMRALGWTAVGVALWWIALTVLDLHRTGVIH